MGAMAAGQPSPSDAADRSGGGADVAASASGAAAEGKGEPGGGADAPGAGSGTGAKSAAPAATGLGEITPAEGEHGAAGVQAQGQAGVVGGTTSNGGAGAPASAAAVVVAGGAVVGAATAPPPPGTTELPTCPVCLERLDEYISGIVTTVGTVLP